MNEAAYGIFSSLTDAERAVSALKDHGVTGNEISVVSQADGAGLPGVEKEASEGVTLTSPGDTVAGALKGGAAGLALGVLAGAVALTIPGLGPILAAGPLSAAIGATLMSTAAGAIGGGVIGSLVDQGVPEEAATHYQDQIARGNILVTARSARLDAVEAELLMQKYGAIHTARHGVGDPITPDEPAIVDREAEMESSVLTTPTPPAPRTP